MRRVAHPQPLRLDAGRSQTRNRRFDRRHRSRDNDIFGAIPRGDFQSAFAPRHLGLDHVVAREHGRHRATVSEFLRQAAAFGDQPNRIGKRQHARRVRGGIFPEAVTERGDGFDAP